MGIDDCTEGADTCTAGHCKCGENDKCASPAYCSVGKCVGKGLPISNNLGRRLHLLLIMNIDIW